MYVAESAPPELKNQAQGLIMLLTAGIGVFLSNFVFHRVLENSVVSQSPLRHDWSKPYWVALAMTLSMPPAEKMPNTSTQASAMDMMTDWIRSVTEAARKPPSTV